MFELYMETKVPSINHYWFANGHRRYISKKGNEFKSLVARRASEKGVIPLTGDVQITINWYKKGRMRGDLDNILKVIMDSLNGVGYKDDSQVKSIIAYMWEEHGVDAVQIKLDNFSCS